MDLGVVIRKFIFHFHPGIAYSDSVDYVIQADVAEQQRQLMSMVDGQPEELYVNNREVYLESFL